MNFGKKVWDGTNNFWISSERDPSKQKKVTQNL